MLKQNNLWYNTYGDKMDNQVYGVLHGVIEDKRIIALKTRKRVNFFYMSKGMFKSFMMYFNSGIYVFITVNSNTKIYKGHLVQNIVSIDKILSPNKNNPKIYYDISIIKSGVKRIVNEPRNRLFIDFEMSMPPYTDYEKFVSEIIQVGYVLTDKNGNKISEYKSYIKPTLFPKISPRTIKFLNINQDEVDGGISYNDFYHKLNDIYYEYNPIVFVWGKNDQLELNKLNRIHRLRNFTKTMQFIDLLNLHKIYFGLKNDMGLFNAYNGYSDECLNNQKHDAFEDAVVTSKIFEYFKLVCNNIMQVNFN